MVLYGSEKPNVSEKKSPPSSVSKENQSKTQSKTGSKLDESQTMLRFETVNWYVNILW
jgi:hypothetical protein